MKKSPQKLYQSRGDYRQLDGCIKRLEQRFVLTVRS